MILSFHHRVLCIFLCFVFGIIDSSAQQNDSLAFFNLEKGKNALFYAKNDKAITHLKLALKAFKASKKHLKTAESYNLLSRAYISKNNIEEALVTATKALKISRQNTIKNKLEEVIALNSIGTIERVKGNFDQSKKDLKLALSISLEFIKDNSYNLSYCYYNLARTYHRSGNYKDAIEHLNLALNSLQDESSKGKALKANISETFGQINYDQGDFEAAFVNFKNTYEFSKEAYHDETNHPYFIEIYNQLGLIYNQNKEFNEGEKYFQKALSLSVLHYGLDTHQSQLRIHFNLGMSYLDRGFKEESLFHTKKALEMATKMYGKDHFTLHFPYSQLGRIYGDERGIPYIEKAITLLNKANNQRSKIIASFSYAHLASIYYDIEDYSKALENIQESLKIRIKYFGKNNINTIESLNNMAKVYLKLNDYEKALDYNNEAIRANYLGSLNQQNKPEFFQSISYLNNKLQLDATKTKADILLELYQVSDNKEYLIESNKFYKKAESLINWLRNTKRNYNDKIKFSSTTKTIYGKIIETELLMHSLDENFVSKDSIFYYSEKSRANVLRELAKNSKVKEVSNVNTEIITLENYLNNEISKLTSQIIKEISNKVIDTTKLYTLEGRLFDISKSKDSLEHQIEKDFPKYYGLKYEKPIVSISEIQSHLDEETTFIEFFKSQTHITVYIITKSTIDIKTLDVKNLDETIQVFNTDIINKDENAFTKTASDLYQQLIKPIKENFKGDKLIIVPDESLWFLQFDLLINSDYTRPNHKPNYLLYDYAISYANSASMLYESNFKHSSKDILNECMAFSYTINDSVLKNNEIDLPGSRKEITELSHVFKGKYFFDDDANETNFKTYVNKYKLIHLALHAEIDSLNPEIIKIHFSESLKNNKEDNILYGHELYTVNIPADLVVLSACNTGVGKINKGEGILSLGNAFQYAGAKSLMLSRWKISDETTPEIMKLFYKNLKKGITKSKALQQAKIDYLNTTNVFTSHPYYWGSFYILGDTNTVELSSTSSNIYYYIGGFITLCFGVFMFRRKKTKKIG